MEMNTTKTYKVHRFGSQWMIECSDGQVWQARTKAQAEAWVAKLKAR